MIGKKLYLSVTNDTINSKQVVNLDDEEVDQVDIEVVDNVYARILVSDRV